jgi:hypothetical protein
MTELEKEIIEAIKETPIEELKKMIKDICKKNETDNQH